MAAIDLLRQQHRDVEQLFVQLKTAEKGRKVALLGKLAEDLTVHATLEERFFYPIAERNPELAGLISGARREHAQVRGWMSEIMELKQRDPRIDQLIAQIEQAVTAHVAEEEREVFPRLEADAAAMQQLGEQMQQAQRELRGQDDEDDAEQVPRA